MTLDDLAAIKAIDAHGARDVLTGFAAQCRTAARLAPPRLAMAAPRAVIVAAMGGSAAGADLVAACASDRLAVPVLVHRGYGLPAIAGEGALVIASSYSGDTAEVLSAAETGLARGAAVVALTTGGALARLATARGLPLVTVGGGLVPRMALGYMLFPVLTILGAAGLDVTSGGEVEEALAVAEGLVSDLVHERPTRVNEAKQLARAIGACLPAIYGGPGTGPVAYRWKTDLEENAKAFAVAGTVPEMNHNEIEAWNDAAPRPLHLVLLRDADEPPEIGRCFALVRELCGPRASGVSEAWGRGRGRLARLLSLAYLGQWTSYYVAMLRGIDPWLVPTLDELKRRMRS